MRVPSGEGYSCTRAKEGLRAGSAPAARARAWTSAVLPEPRSPLSQTTLPGLSVRHQCAAACSSSASVYSATAPTTCPPPPPHTGGRGRRGRGGLRPLGALCALCAPCAPSAAHRSPQFENLVSELSRQLEVQVRRRLPHLLLQDLDQVFPIQVLGQRLGRQIGRASCR